MDALLMKLFTVHLQCDGDRHHYLDYRGHIEYEIKSLNYAEGKKR